VSRDACVDAHIDFCAAHQVRPSVGRTGICFDNAVAESFWESQKEAGLPVSAACEAAGVSTSGSHQPRHPLLVHDDVGATQLTAHARHPVVPVRRVEDLFHQRDQLGFGDLALGRPGRLAGAMVVVLWLPRSGCPITPATRPPRAAAAMVSASSTSSVRM
jgi:hypothetical protein